MKLRYDAPKNSRINYRFLGFTTFDNGWWYDKILNKWVNNPDFKRGGYSTHQPCKTMKAFRRKLKQCPNGVNFILVSRWYNNDIYGKGTKLTER